MLLLDRQLLCLQQLLVLPVLPPCQPSIVLLHVLLLMLLWLHWLMHGADVLLLLPLPGIQVSS